MHCGVCNGWRRHRALLRRAYELCFHVCASFRFLLAVIFHRTFRVSGGFYVLVGFTIVMPAEMALLVLFVFVCLFECFCGCLFFFLSIFVAWFETSKHWFLGYVGSPRLPLCYGECTGSACSVGGKFGAVDHTARCMPLWCCGSMRFLFDQVHPSRRKLLAVI